MNYMESYLYWDWPLASGQLSTGLDVPLPGSDILLPPVDGYLFAPATTLAQDIKRQPEEFQPLDHVIDDDWTSRDNSVIQNPDHLFSEFEPTDLLPSSPEGDSFDLDMVNFGHSSWEPAVHLEVAGDEFASVVRLDSATSLGEGSVRVLETDPVKFFEDSGRFDSDFDPEWLLSSSTEPILTPVSLEEVESVLSASPPLDISTSPDDGMFSSAEFKRQFAKMPSSFEGCFSLSESPLNLLLEDTQIISESTRLAVAQVPQTVTWIGDCSVGGVTPCFRELQVPDNPLIVATTSLHLSSTDSNSSFSVGTTLSFEESGSDSVGKLSNPGCGLVRVEPYPTAKPERRERKREQNKTAASKYRQRKRAEQGSCLSEQEQLEKRNVELKSRVDELAREISYLKGLISEIYSSETN
jgi:hypothetical protein